MTLDELESKAKQCAGDWMVMDPTNVLKLCAIVRAADGLRAARVFGTEGAAYDKARAALTASERE